MSFKKNVLNTLSNFPESIELEAIETNSYYDFLCTKLNFMTEKLTNKEASKKEDELISLYNKIVSTEIISSYNRIFSENSIYEFVKKYVFDMLDDFTSQSFAKDLDKNKTFEITNKIIVIDRCVPLNMDNLDPRKINLQYQSTYIYRKTIGTLIEICALCDFNLFHSNKYFQESVESSANQYSFFKKCIKADPNLLNSNLFKDISGNIPFFLPELQSGISNSLKKAGKHNNSNKQKIRKYLLILYSFHPESKNFKDKDILEILDSINANLVQDPKYLSEIRLSIKK